MPELLKKSVKPVTTRENTSLNSEHKHRHFHADK
jgi:hypothetical protein